MRGIIDQYSMLTSKSLNEALERFSDPSANWIPFAGGTDLMVQYEAGHLPAGNYLNILPFAELKGIRVFDDRVEIGSLCSYSEIRAHPLLQAEFPNLCQSAKETGGIAIQNRGTIGGNIANASPAADSPPSLLVYDAKIQLVSHQKSRSVPYADFHVGYKKTLRERQEIISVVTLPRVTEMRHHYFRKVGTRNAQAISKVVMAGVMSKDKGTKIISHLKIALGSVAATPIRCLGIERFLLGKAGTLADIKVARSILANEIKPLDDIRSTGDYRLWVAGNLLEEMLSRDI